MTTPAHLIQMEFAGFPAATAAKAKQAARSAKAKARSGVTPILLIKRKFRLRWSDLELLVLLEMGRRPVTFAGLVEETGGSTSGVWNVLSRCMLVEEFAEKQIHAGRTYYALTNLGKIELAKILA
jgi:hypothetical protein